MLSIHHIHLPFLFSLLLALSACGGGGGSSTPANNNTLTFNGVIDIDVGGGVTATGYTADATASADGEIAYSLTGGSDQVAFNINSVSGELSFNTFPVDDNYEVVVTATEDSSTGGSVTLGADTVTVTVTGSTANPPVFTSGLLASVAENNLLIGYVATATDDDTGDVVTFSVEPAGSGADQGAFSITSGGVLSFQASAPDFESPTDSDSLNTYEVEITATDGTNAVTQIVTVTVTDLNDNAPAFTSGTAISVAENSLLSGYTAAATDADDGNVVTFSVEPAGSGADQGAFTIDGSSGVLSFQAPAPNFESPTDSGAPNTYEVEITATDSINSTVQTVTVTITDVNEFSPVFSSGVAVSVAEGSTVTGYTATATDADASGTVAFSLTGGADLAAFVINSGTGVLSFGTAPEVSSDRAYVVDITASDGTNTAVQTVTVTVINAVGAAPVFTSANSNSVFENTLATGYTAVATDADGDAVAYSLAGGVDQSFFTIVPGPGTDAGLLTFNIARDFDSPEDSGGDNTYVVDIEASDSVNTVIRTVTISITNLNDNAPVFTSDTLISVAEGSTDSGYMAATMDDDAGDSVSFSITGGTDADDFVINGTSGVLTFNSVTDTASPADSDLDNVYVVDITATDNGTIPGILSTVQTVTITVGAAGTLSVTTSIADVKTIQFDWAAYSGATYYKLLRNPDGVSGYSLLQDNLAGTSTTVVLSLHLTDWMNATYRLEAYDGSDTLLVASDPISIDTVMLSSIGYVKANNTGWSDLFGGSVSLSADGNTLAVGAYWESSAATGISTDASAGSDDLAASAGAVYVYSYDGSSWAQQAYIKASNIEAGDGFSTLSLSANGNTLAVGAYQEDSSATGINPASDSGAGTGEFDNSAADAGAAYVFSRTDSTWTQQAYIKASNTKAGDHFGYDVYLSDDGSTLAVGADGEDSAATGIDGNQTDDCGASELNCALDSGAVYVFSYDGSVWAQQAYIKASNTGAGDFFGGQTVSLSENGNTLAVGAPMEDSVATGISTDGTGEGDDSVTDAGAVYIFGRTGSIWAQQAYVKASNTGTFDLFGFDVSLSANGNTLAVGAYGEASSAMGISTDGTGESSDAAASTGAAYLFSYDGSNWTQQAYVKASNAGLGDEFGYSLRLSADGNTLAVGARYEDSQARGVSTDGTGESDNSAIDAGAAYVFSYNGSIWSQQAYIKASNTQPPAGWGGGGYETFGFSVTLSGDGSALAIGAFMEDSGATGIGGDQADLSGTNSGAVYLY